MKETFGSFGIGLGARVMTVSLLIILLAGSHSLAQLGGLTAPLSAEEAAAIATDAYIYGYPLTRTFMRDRIEYTR